MLNEPQKSEVHESTADASSSPTGDREADATRESPHGRGERAWADGPRPVAPVPPSDVKVIRDETDDGGPLVIQSGDPDLNPPRAPVDPFPTLGTPEIDPPIKET